MKVLFAATPLAGHVNPIIALARMVLNRGDEASLITASYLQPMVENAGVRFLPLMPEAHFDLSNVQETFPDIYSQPPGPGQLLRLFERTILEPMSAQLQTMRAAIAEEEPDIVVADSLFLGRAALYVDPNRPAVPLVACGITYLTLGRPDGAPVSLGLPPAQDDTTRARYAEMNR